MAEHVYQTLKSIIQKYGGMSENEVQSFLLSLRVSNISIITYQKYVNNLLYKVSRNNRAIFPGL